MNLASFPASRVRSPAVADAPLLHAECPLEQIVRSDEPDVLSGLMQEPWAQRRHEGVTVIGECNGLRLLGRSEGTLEAVVALLQRRFDNRLVVDAPSVRQGPHPAALEPWMTVLVSAPGRYEARIRGDFLRRGGRVMRLQPGEAFLLEGEAPLAQLLGYERWLHALSPTAHASLWLRGYLPPMDEGPGAA